MSIRERLEGMRRFRIFFCARTLNDGSCDLRAINLRIRGGSRFRFIESVLLCALVGFGTACQRTTSGGVESASLLREPSNPAFTERAPSVSRLHFTTTRGMFVLQLNRSWGPLGADRLYNLARLGYYDNTRFHRVRANYIVQFGLHGDSAVNAAWRGMEIADDPPRSDNRRGTFAFSYAGPGKPNTRNTQIYINLSDNLRNNEEAFTVLGTVIDGMSVVDSLYSGYGEESGSGVRQGKQGPLANGGNAYVDRHFPKLDRIVRVTVSTEVP